MPKPKFSPAPVGPGRLACFLFIIALAQGVYARQADPNPQPAKPVLAPAKPTPTPAPPEPDAAASTGPEVVVFLKDGQRFAGLLVSENADHLVLRVAGIQTEFGSKLIDHYQVLAPILERYRQIRNDIGDDPDRILMLVEWLRVREQYELAIKEVDRVLAADANKGEAKRLRRLLEEQIKLRGSARVPVAGNTRAGGNPVPRGAERASRTFPLLDERQINLLKVFELNLDDPPRLVIRRDTIKRMLEENAGSALIPTTQEGRDAIYRKAPVEVLDLMFRLKARDLYAQVEVQDQPKSMRAFRDGVESAWLVNSCATNACHGGEEAGRLALYNHRPRSDASVYTNFLILDRFRMADGRPLINYDDPEKSPLLQLGLPREDSLARHPAAPMGRAGRDGWRAVFKSTSDPQFRQAVAWIESMYKPHPAYPIEYHPPGADKGAPKPASKEPTDR